MKGWRTAARTLEHPEGTLVARPAHKRGCWGTTTGSTSYVGRLRLPRSCSLQARAGGFLTCNAHRSREADARALRDQLDKQGSDE